MFRRVQRSYDTLRWAVDDLGVATIALDEPDSRNALSDAVMSDLLVAFAAARDDDAVRCVVLASTHPTTFSAGGNLGGFASDVPLAHKHDANGRFPALFTLIGELGRHHTVILSSHILPEVSATCERVVIIQWWALSLATAGVVASRVVTSSVASRSWYRSRARARFPSLTEE